MERDTAVSGADADRQSGPFLKHVDILRVASKKLASDAQSIEQTMCLRRPRDEGFLTKLPRDFEQTRTPFWGTCRAFGEDLSLPVETIVRPEVLSKSAAFQPFQLHAYRNLGGCTDASTQQNHDLLCSREAVCDTPEAVFVARIVYRLVHCRWSSSGRLAYPDDELPPMGRIKSSEREGFRGGVAGRPTGFIPGDQLARRRVTCVGRGAPCHFMLGKSAGRLCRQQSGPSHA